MPHSYWSLMSHILAEADFVMLSSNRVCTSWGMSCCTVCKCYRPLKRLYILLATQSTSGPILQQTSSTTHAHFRYITFHNLPNHIRLYILSSLWLSNVSNELIMNTSHQTLLEVNFVETWLIYIIIVFGDRLDKKVIRRLLVGRSHLGFCKEE